MSHTQSRLDTINARLAVLLPVYEASGNASTGWKEIYALRQEKADFLRPTVEVDTPDYSTESQIISKFKLGDLIGYHGIIVKVDEIKVFPSDERPELPVYVLYCTYHSGSLAFFHQQEDSINSGTGRGYRIRVQSNDLGQWALVSFSA
jgi:hypothetical protein